MKFSRKGSERYEGTHQTEGSVFRARFRVAPRAVVATLRRVPNFGNGIGTHDWEVAVSVPELGQLVSVLAMEANGRYRKSIARDLLPHLESLRALVDACERHETLSDTKTD
jgi:hypothetical protein